MKQYAELSQANADGAKKLADAFAPLYEGFPADQKALADTTFRSWLHHGGEHRGKGKTKGTDGKAAAAPAASAPRSPDARPAGAVPPVRAERRRARRPARHTAREFGISSRFYRFPPFPSCSNSSTSTCAPIRRPVASSRTKPSPLPSRRPTAN